jgi:hypothetical protein
VSTTCLPCRRWRRARVRPGCRVPFSAPRRLDGAIDGLLVDLSDLVFIDSSGLAVLVEVALAGLRRRLNVFASRVTARRD